MEKHRANKIKKVNILSRVPIRNVVPPIHGCHNGIMMDTSNILKCINKRAVVNEVLPDGSVIRLNLSNYYKDNASVVETPISAPVVEVEPKVETVVKVEEPAVSEAELAKPVDITVHESISSVESAAVVEDTNTNGIADVAVSVSTEISNISTDVAVNAETTAIGSTDTAVDEQVVDDDVSDTNTNDEEEVSAVAEAAEDHVPTYKNKKNKNHRH